jgi:hypothetical protein
MGQEESDEGVTCSRRHYLDYEVLCLVAVTSAVLAICMMAMTLFMTDKYKSIIRDNDRAISLLEDSYRSLDDCKRSLGSPSEGDGQ